MARPAVWLVLLALVFVGWTPLLAQTPDTTRYRILLEDGRTITGTLLEAGTEGEWRIRDLHGEIHRFPLQAIREIRPVKAKTDLSRWGHRGRFYGCLGAGLGFNADRSLRFGDASLGWRFMRSLSLGAGTGVYHFPGRYDEFVKPLFLEWRGEWSHRPWVPYSVLRAGVGFVSVTRHLWEPEFIDREDDPGFMLQVMGGIRAGSLGRSAVLAEAGFLLQQMAYVETRAPQWNQPPDQISRVRKTYPMWTLRLVVAF